MYKRGQKLEKKKIVYGFCMIFLFLMALGIRGYQIGSMPEGIHIDEAGMWYDIRSLMEYGVDRYGKHFPVYFINFGGGQNALYGYLCLLCFRLFGESLTILRIPAVVMGMCTWLFGTLIFREYLGRKGTLLGAFLLTVFPCFIMQSRLGLESLLFLSVSTVSLYLLIQAIRRQKWYLFVLDGVTWGICLYTYAVSYIVIPLFLLILLLYLWYIKRIKWSQILCMGVPLGILAAPLILMLLINALDLPEISCAWFTIPRLLEFRGAEVSLRNVLSNIAELFQVYFFNDSLGYNSVSGYFTMYVWSVPFALYGFQKSAKKIVEQWDKKEFQVPVVLLLWFLAVTCMGLLTRDVNVNKVNAVYFVLTFYVLYGILSWEQWLEKESFRFRQYCLPVLAALYFCCFLSFERYYYTDYKNVYDSGMFGETYSEILDKYEDVIENKTVYTSSSYIFYALGENLSPEELALSELGGSSRENIVFTLPAGSDENGFYLLGRSDAGKRNRLEEEGFTWSEEGFYRIYYK